MALTKVNKIPAFLRDALEGILKREDFVKDSSEHSTIDGLKVIDLKTSWADDGFFAELGRINDDYGLLKDIGEQLPDFQLKQLNLSNTLPNQVKGFHLHLDQDEVWFIPPQSRAIIGAVDVRKESSSSGNVVRIVLNGNNNNVSVVHFPRGVAHAICPVNSPLLMVVGVSNHFNGEDEWRLSYDFQVGEDFWKIPHG